VILRLFLTQYQRVTNRRRDKHRWCRSLCSATKSLQFVRISSSVNVQSLQRKRQQYYLVINMVDVHTSSTIVEAEHCDRDVLERGRVHVGTWHFRDKGWTDHVPKLTCVCTEIDHVPKVSSCTEMDHCLKLCTEMVCTESVLYRYGSTPGAGGPGVPLPLGEGTVPPPPENVWIFKIKMTCFWLLVHAGAWKAAEGLMSLQL